MFASLRFHRWKDGLLWARYSCQDTSWEIFLTGYIWFSVAPQLWPKWAQHACHCNLTQTSSAALPPSLHPSPSAWTGFFYRHGLLALFCPWPKVFPTSPFKTVHKHPFIVKPFLFSKMNEIWLLHCLVLSNWMAGPLTWLGLCDSSLYPKDIYDSGLYRAEIRWFGWWCETLSKQFTISRP